MLTCTIKVGNSSGGVIKSPNYGEKYPTGLNRLYVIQASPGRKILLEPVVLKVEGQMSPDGQYGVYLFISKKELEPIHCLTNRSLLFCCD